MLAIGFFYLKDVFIYPDYPCGDILDDYPWMRQLNADVNIRIGFVKPLDSALYMLHIIHPFSFRAIFAMT